MPADARRPRDYPILFLKGLAMGAANVVPGVSGGTMALILGIYRELIASLDAISRRETLAALFSGRFIAAGRQVRALFLFSVVLGVAVAVVALSGLMVAALATARSLVFALFFGLILASVFTVARRIERWRATTVIGLLSGAVLGFWLVGLTPTITPTTAPFLALTGALAICSLILPGVSGAFILVLLGKYDFVLSAISEFDLVTLLPVALGAGAGLLAFTRLLAWMLRRAEGLTLALLTGFMFGSLRKVWPWQEAAEGASRNMVPPDTLAATIAVVFALAGGVLVLTLDQFGGRGQRSGDDRQV